jgi:hypothetical protein
MHLLDLGTSESIAAARLVGFARLSRPGIIVYGGTMGKHRPRRRQLPVPLAVPLVVMKMRRASAVALLVMKGAACRLPSLGIERRRDGDDGDGKKRPSTGTGASLDIVSAFFQGYGVFAYVTRLVGVARLSRPGIMVYGGTMGKQTGRSSRAPRPCAVAAVVSGVRQSSRARRVKEGRHGAAARRTCSVHHEETKALHPLGAAQLKTC